jgi:glycosyltransferase involved in cell wall biosynthesis
LRDKIRVIFDGIDSGTVRPDAGARFTLPNGRVLTATDEVITYVARNLEPYRGYPNFIRALPSLLAQRPEAQVVIVGGDEVSYGRSPPEAASWREHMAREVSLDPARVHFTGKLPYARYLALLQVSSLHIYLTVPFVLSWSCLEAMSAGCLVLASDTAPVAEAIAEGANGLLCDFHSPADIADRAAAALAARAELAPLRKAARQTVLDRYEVSRCLPAQMRLVEEVAAMRA